MALPMTTRSGLCARFARVAVHHGDFFGGEERRHRLIDILVRAGDGKALVLHRRRGGRHRRAADAGEMN
jgi:hypothetical protein